MNKQTYYYYMDKERIEWINPTISGALIRSKLPPHLTIKNEFGDAYQIWKKTNDENDYLVEDGMGFDLSEREHAFYTIPKGIAKESEARGNELTTLRARISELTTELGQVAEARDAEKKAADAMGRFCDHLRVRFAGQLREAWKPHDDKIQCITDILKKKLDELDSTRVERDTARAEVERLRGVVMSALDIARGDHEKTPTLYNVEEFLRTALLTAAPVATEVDNRRLIPALACNIASRALWLRQLIVKEPTLFTAEQVRRLKPFTDTMPFEKELLSGDMAQVEKAIEGIAATLPPPPAQEGGEGK